MKKWIWRALTVFCLIKAAPVYAQVDAEQVVNIGRNVLSMEDYLLSIQYFNQAIKAKPYLAEPYFLRALAKLNLEDYRGAEDDCTLAIERNKFKTECYKLRGFARQSQGKDSLAVADYDIGLTYNPQDKYFLFYKAVAQTELKDYPGADSTFATLLRLYPRFDDGFTARGRLNVVRGDTTAALADVSRSIELSSSNVQPYLMRADINAKRRAWNDAMQDMDQAIRLKPHEADYYVNRAFLRYNLDDWFGAMSDYNYTLELEPYNVSALFNRALLRYEVKDLDRAAGDLKSVLNLKPDNFHARYNLGLVDLERGKNREALLQFDTIAKRYPKFYPVYYARAEALRNMNNMRAAMQSVRIADELVKGYVKNPEKNPLDRPTISPGKSNDGSESHDDESEEETMDRFNQLVTVAPSETELAYNDKIKGRVQDRDVSASLEPIYGLSFIDSPASLKATSNYFRELDDFNRAGFIANRIYLTSNKGVSSAEYDRLFALVDAYQQRCDTLNPRPADLLALGVAKTMLKDLDGARLALDKAIEMYPDFVVAYMARGVLNAENSDKLGMVAAINDFDAALRLNPRLVYALFNKGNIYYNAGDYTSALQCYGEAVAIDPSFASAYYNRGITYLRMGNRRSAFADLSKAGELGVLPSYNILKRMK